MKILISAYACEPHKGSDPQVGWKIVNLASKCHEIWVLTRKNNRPFIETYLSDNNDPNIHFVYIDLPGWMRFWKRGVRGFYFYHILWQLAAFFFALRLHKIHKFDLAHHATFANIWEPSLFSFLPIPFVWGPVFGVKSIPKEFYSEIGCKGAIQEQLRKIFYFLGRYVNPLTRYSYNKAKSIIITGQVAHDLFPKKYSYKLVKWVFSGGLCFKGHSKKKVDNKDPFVIVTASRLVYRKGVRLTIRSFAQYLKTYNENALLKIIGDGSEFDALHKIVNELKIEDNVSFLGWLDSEKLINELVSSDVFLYLSLRETPIPSILNEAMSLGLPIITLDIPGLQELYYQNVGIKISASAPDDAIKKTAKALKLLHDDYGLRAKMGNNAKKLINLYTWETKEDELNRIYNSAVNFVNRK